MLRSGEADGGEVNGWGRTVPEGGTLDPVTGTWGRLADAPRPGSGGWLATALGGARIATDGFLYDDDRGLTASSFAYGP